MEAVIEEKDTKNKQKEEEIAQMTKQITYEKYKNEEA